ncbi:uncharacterized protein LOC117175604 [Belonocnema kinseyi]|uniref:uncharacterized protein LOC117175604 n=1 Tax=Belonocnema kinseyi TaxID=2817044 RepID=UPI00143DB280|nr:uncharacterized protein LOC117175604 [Belonocnema kinseyi]
MSAATTFSLILDEIGPLQATAATIKPSKRGRKTMGSSELTSPENIVVLKEKAEAAKKLAPKKPTPKKAKPPAKRSKANPSPLSDEDADLCTICLKFLPTTLTAFNSIKCISSKRLVRLKCANMRTSFYTCKHCDSDFD